MTAKWKQIESYHDSKAMHESKFNITKKQAQMILDLKKKELQKSKYLSIVDISSTEVKKLAKKDKSIEKVIGKLGGSFRVNLLKSKADSKSGAVGGYRQMKSRTPAQLRALRKQMGIKNWDEDAPTVHTGPAIAGTGDDSSTVVVRKKKKKKKGILIGDKPITRLDGRTKAYKLHAKKLLAQREKRQKLKAGHCENFTKGLKEKFNSFAREEFIVEDNVAILRKIVKDKRNMPVKLKDGQMKVDLYTASAFVQTLDNKKIKPNTKKKLEFIINKGSKSQFLRAVNVIFK